MRFRTNPLEAQGAAQPEYGFVFRGAVVVALHIVGELGEHVEVLADRVTYCEVDFVAVVDRVIELAPEAVFMGGYSADLIPLITEIRKRPELANTYLFTSSSFLPEKVISATDIETVEGIMFSSYPWEPASGPPNMQSFAARFQEKYYVAPDNYAANGYDAGVIMVHAIEKANHWMVDAIRDELNGNIFDAETTGELILRNTDFNKRGDVTRIPVVYRVVNGQIVKLTPEDMEVIKTDILTRI
jgi:branched-chain amino acid transport system substrate-binding protein